jgi:hypothetical protein
VQKTLLAEQPLSVVGNLDGSSTPLLLQMGMMTKGDACARLDEASD